MRTNREIFELGIDRFSLKFVSIFTSQQPTINFQEIEQFKKTLDMVKKLTLEEYEFIELLEQKEEKAQQ